MGERFKVSVRANRLFLLLVLVSVAVAMGIALMSGQAIRYEDERDYFGLAQRVSQGLGYVTPALTPTAYRPPGYPLLMVPFAGAACGVLWLKLLNAALLGVALCLMRALVARETPLVAWMAGGAALCYPVWLYAASTLYPQILCMVLLLALVYLLSSRTASWWAFLCAGVLFGYLILVAPSFQLLGPVLALYVAVWGPFTVGRNLVAAAVLGGVTLLTLAPWYVRNYQVFGEFVPVATNGGINLLLGNSEFTRPNSGVAVDLSRYEAQVQGYNEVETSRAFQRFAVEWVKAHPVDAARLYVQKALNYYNYRAETVTEQPGSKWKDGLMFVTYYPLLLLVLFRLMLARRLPLSRMEGLLLGLYVVNGLLAALFFTRLRFRLPLDGLLMTLAIIALGRLAAWKSSRASGRV